MKTKLREDQKRLQVSNPASGFTITLDEDCSAYLGGLYNTTSISTKLIEDGSVRVRVKENKKGRHKIVKRTSGNRYAKTRIVDRHEDVTGFPEEFGPTLVSYKFNNEAVEFIVPPLHKRRKPITRLQKEVKTPAFDLITRTPMNEDEGLFHEFIEASRKLHDAMKKILEDPEISKLVKEKFFKEIKH